MKKSFQNKWLWLIPIVFIVAIVLMVFLIGQFTPVLTAWIFKHPIDATTFASPPNFPAIQENVVVKKDIAYNEQGTLLDIYYPKNAKLPLPTIMWIHGGGFIGGSKENTQAYAMTLANAGYVVANINYDLAPAHKYPAQLLQANQALKYLNENVAQYGGDPSRIFIGSNSSGSQLASQLVALVSNKEFTKTLNIQPSITGEQLRGVLLYDGAYDMRTLKATGAPGMGLFLWSYTGVRDYESFTRIDELSTVMHITSDYPPVFLTVGDADRLEPQSLELVKVLESKGVEVESVFFTGTNAHLGHDFMMDLSTQPAQQTLKKALDFLAKHSKQ